MKSVDYLHYFFDFCCAIEVVYVYDVIRNGLRGRFFRAIPSNSMLHNYSIVLVICLHNKTI